MNNLPHSQRVAPPSMPLMGQLHHQNQNSYAGFGGNNSNHTNASFFPPSNNQQPNQITPNSSSIRSYADYRTSSGLPPSNAHSSMYAPPLNPHNPVAPPSRTFDEFGLSPFAHGASNPYDRPREPAFSNEEPHYGNFGHQNQLEQSPQTSWRGSSRGRNNNVRGRGAGSFQSSKQPGSTFSYSSSSNNNSPSARGRGAGRNARNFGSRR